MHKIKRTRLTRPLRPSSIVLGLSLAGFARGKACVAGGLAFGFENDLLFGFADLTLGLLDLFLFDPRDAFKFGALVFKALRFGLLGNAGFSGGGELLAGFQARRELCVIGRRFGTKFFECGLAGVSCGVAAVGERVGLESEHGSPGDNKEDERVT